MHTHGCPRLPTSSQCKPSQVCVSAWSACLIVKIETAQVPDFCNSALLCSLSNVPCPPSPPRPCAAMQLVSKVCVSTLSCLARACKSMQCLACTIQAAKHRIAMAVALVAWALFTPPLALSSSTAFTLATLPFPPPNLAQVPTLPSAFSTSPTPHPWSIISPVEVSSWHSVIGCWSIRKRSFSALPLHADPALLAAQPARGCIALPGSVLLCSSASGFLNWVAQTDQQKPSSSFLHVSSASMLASKLASSQVGDATLNV